MLWYRSVRYFFLIIFLKSTWIFKLNNSILVQSSEYAHAFVFWASDAYVMCILLDLLVFTFLPYILFSHVLGCAGGSKPKWITFGFYLLCFLECASSAVKQYLYLWWVVLLLLLPMLLMLLLLLLLMLLTAHGFIIWLHHKFTCRRCRLLAGNVYGPCWHAA